MPYSQLFRIDLAFRDIIRVSRNTVILPVLDVSEYIDISVVMVVVVPCLI